MPLPKSLSRVSELAQGFRSDDWRDSLPLWVSAGLVLVLAWQLVQLLWTALSAGPAAAITPAGNDRPAIPSGPPVDISGIVNAHLFGIAPVPGASELDPSAAPTFVAPEATGSTVLVFSTPRNRLQLGISRKAFEFALRYGLGATGSLVDRHRIVQLSYGTRSGASQWRFDLDAPCAN